MPQLDVEAARRALSGSTIGNRILHYPSLDSTMDEAGRLVAAGCPEGLRRSHGAADGWPGSIRPVVDLRTRREPAPVDCPQADRRAAPAGEHGRDPCRCQDGGQARRRPGHHQVAQRRKDRRSQGGGHTDRGGLTGRTNRQRRGRHRASTSASTLPATRRSRARRPVSWRKTGAPVERTAVLIDLLRQLDELYSHVRSGGSLTGRVVVPAGHPGLGNRSATGQRAVGRRSPARSTTGATWYSNAQAAPRSQSWEVR